MKIYNSKSNKIETFIPIKEGKVSLYLCGPTVYNYAHIGNARPIVVFDLLRRVLEEKGYEVEFVSNYTDIDDRIIEKALKEMTTEKEIADRYISAYEMVRYGLHADEVDQKPRVTQVIPDIIEFIEALIDKGYAYVVEGDVYFRVNRVETYGQISNQKLDELKVGARIEENVQKENPLDFVLWKKTYDEGITWDSPWGKGRPGWHTECVVMIHNAFGDRIDIHAGGQDLRFPHHENESAQSYAYHQHDLANYWVHNAMLQIDGEKMSKSLGNVIWAQDYIDKFGSNVTRWLLLSTHYRLTLNISDETIKQSKKEINRIETALKNAYINLELKNINLDDYNIDKDNFDQFMKYLKDDLNVANAQVVLFEKIKDVNANTRSKSFDRLASDVKTVERMLDILGIVMDRIKLDSDQKELFKKWDQYKENEEFDKADVIRQQLIEMGLL